MVLEDRVVGDEGCHHASNYRVREGVAKGCCPAVYASPLPHALQLTLAALRKV